VHQASASLKLDVNISTAAQVERALNEIRLAVLGVLVGIGLTVFFGVSGPWWERAAWGLASVGVAGFLIGWSRSRNVLMDVMHRLTGK